MSVEVRNVRESKKHKEKGERKGKMPDREIRHDGGKYDDDQR